MTEKKTVSKLIIFYLLLLNFFALNVLFLSRYPAQKAQEALYLKKGNPEFLNLFQKVRLYFSFPQDLALYYRFANQALGYPQTEISELTGLGKLAEALIFNRKPAREYFENFPALNYPRKISDFSPAKGRILETDPAFAAGGAHDPAWFPLRYARIIRPPLFAPWPSLRQYVFWSMASPEPKQAVFFRSIPDPFRYERVPFTEGPRWMRWDTWREADAWLKLKQSMEPDRADFEKKQRQSYGIYLPDASSHAAASLPYRDFLVEYPPLVLLPVLYARMASWDFFSFAQIYGVIVAVCAAASLFLAFKILRTIPEKDRISTADFLLYSFLSLIAIGIVFPTRLDIFPALLSTLALWCLVTGRYKTCALVLALATATKLYPVIYTPILGFTLLSRKRYAETVWCGLIFSATLFAIFYPVYAFSDGKFLASFAYHSLRPLEIESLYGNVVLLQRWLFGVPAWPLYSFGSTNVANAYQEILMGVATALPFLALLGISLVYLFKSVKSGGRNLTGLQINFFILTTLTFILTCKVFSPQYLIWLFPMIFLVQGEKKRLLIFVYIAACFLSQLIFPGFFVKLARFDAVAIALLTLRNALVVFFFSYLLFRQFKEHKSA